MSLNKTSAVYSQSVAVDPNFNMAREFLSKAEVAFDLGKLTEFQASRHLVLLALGLSSEVIAAGR